MACFLIPYSKMAAVSSSPVKNLTRILSQISIRTASCNNFSPDACETWVPKEKKTHTGQMWEKDDYRLVRFIDKPKQVNTQFAIDLIKATPPMQEKSRIVSCDGGGGPTGHPKVYINLDKPGNHACGYCGLRFYINHDH